MFQKPSIKHAGKGLVQVLEGSNWRKLGLMWRKLVLCGKENIDV